MLSQLACFTFICTPAPFQQLQCNSDLSGSCHSAQSAAWYATPAATS